MKLDNESRIRSLRKEATRLRGFRDSYGQKIVSANLPFSQVLMFTGCYVDMTQKLEKVLVSIRDLEAQNV